jgi:hypothetical protein
MAIRRMTTVVITQLIRFVVVKLNYLGLNFRFNMCVIFTANYSFSGRRRPIDNDVLLMTDFVNLKIKVDLVF